MIVFVLVLLLSVIVVVVSSALDKNIVVVNVIVDGLFVVLLGLKARATYNLTESSSSRAASAILASQSRFYLELLLSLLLLLSF